MRERWIAAYVCVGVGACFSPAPPAGIPCGPGFSCPNDQTCDIVTNECGPPSEALVWRDDTAADFTAAGANTSDVTVERQGFVGPIGYLAGGNRVTGYDGLLVPNAAATFEDIVANNTPTGTSLQRDLDIRFAAHNPPGLGVTDPDSITVLVEGEIELDDDGDWRFRLTANDRGFLDLETSPGSGTFTRVVFDIDAATVGTFTAPIAGWYRYRGAFQDANELLEYRIEYDPPNVAGNGFRDVPIDRLRVRASEVEGLIVDGFESGGLIEHVMTTVSTQSLENLTLDNPLGLPIGVGSLSVRWNGQFLIEQAGDYTFQLAGADGHRMWIDGVSVADEFSTGNATTTAPITLEAGWHDLVIDVTKDGGAQAASIAISVASGPQFAGSWFPATHLRPISGRGARFATDANTSNLNIPDGPPSPPAPATRSLTLDMPATFTPVDVVAAMEIDHALASSVELVCDPPNRNAFTVAAFGSMDSDTNHYFFLPGATPNGAGTWSFIATDNLTDALTGVISAVMVTMVYDGGVAPFPTSYRYESAVRDLGDIVAFERIAWLLRQAPDPAAVVVRLRTCETADACAAETYADVVNGEVPAVPVRRFAQYEVVFTGNGDVPTALDAVELRYFVRGQ